MQSAFCVPIACYHRKFVFSGDAFPVFFFVLRIYHSQTKVCCATLSHQTDSKREREREHCDNIKAPSYHYDDGHTLYEVKYVMLVMFI